MKILIVDDNVRFREVIKKVLTNFHPDYSLIECEDGEEAVVITKKEKLDLILMDIIMKRMDGLLAIKKILEFSPNVKIIVVSQLPEQEYKNEAIEAGANDYLNKEDLFCLPRLIEKLLLDK